MTGLFGTLNTSTGGMRAQQAALQTTAHNLTNMNTAGYSRQRVAMKTAFPQSMAGIGQMGTGVQIAGITRVSDEYITRQLQNELSSLTEHENISDVMGQLEAVFNEPSKHGVAHQMSEFFVSWGNLGENPELKTAKTMVVSQAETFLDTVNHLANQIDNLSTDTVGQIKKEVDDFNAIASQLKSLNDQIFNATVKGEHPNDLFDSQDRLVGKLKDIAGVDVEPDDYGRAMVKLDGNEVVNAGGVTKLSVREKATGEINETNPGRFEFKLKKPPADETIEGTVVELGKGSIKGFETAHAAVIKKEEQLDNFVEKFAGAVNFIMTDGKPEENIPFFTFDIGNLKGPAQNISVNEKLLAKPELLVTGNDFAQTVAGDGSRAKSIADLQNVSLDFSLDSIEFEENLKFIDGTLTIENQTNGSPIFNHYNDIITDMGIIKQQADNMVANQTDLVSLLEQRRESVSGVDINEEVVDMIRFQSAYQANARVISTINEMLDTLINRMGV